MANIIDSTKKKVKFLNISLNKMKNAMPESKAAMQPVPSKYRNKVELQIFILVRNTNQKIVTAGNENKSVKIKLIIKLCPHLLNSLRLKYKQEALTIAFIKAASSQMVKQ